jgi:hypothetical protein
VYTEGDGCWYAPRHCIHYTYSWELSFGAYPTTRM